MKYLVTAEEMKSYDSYTIENLGIPAMILMERAALQTVETIIKNYRRSFSKVLIVCGQGNNGGDGLAVGRLLMDKNISVDFYLQGKREACSKECGKQMDILEKYGAVFLDIFPDKEYDIIIDALFGIGLSRKITGEVFELIEKMNRMQAYKVALDIPSGIHVNDGRVMGTAFKVNLTVTYAYEKRGLHLFPGRDYAGKIQCVDIGITERSFAGKSPQTFTYTEPEAELLPSRKQDGNKGTFGKVLMIAGSDNMSGACTLCAESAYRIGAGMVKVVTTQMNRDILQRTLPEALLWTYDSENLNWKEKFRENLKWATVVVAGPGTGQNKTIEEMLTILFQECTLPLVLDADALNVISKEPALKKMLQMQKERTVVITPHLGEMARLMQKDIAKVKQSILETSLEAVKELQCVVVCKDARTYVIKDNEKIYLNTCGNSGMATAGSGDVLAGIIGGLLAQKMGGYESACIGTYVHAKAAERAARESNEYALIATDIVAQLKRI